MKKNIILFCLLFIVSVNFAGDASRKGTTGADQLLIPVGARGIALGGSFVANVTGIESIYYNPAGLDVNQSNEAMFNYMSHFAGINLSYFAANAQLGSLGSIGLSFKTLDFGDIPVTTVASPDGTGSNYSPSFLIGTITYSKVITDRVAVGFNAKIINESILDVSATGYALDFGVQYSFNNNLKLGATVMNIGGNMEYSGLQLQTKTKVPGSSLQGVDGAYQIIPEAFQLPSYFELSLAYTYAVNDQNSLSLGTRFRNNNVLEDQMAYGLEYNFMSILFLRGGYDMLFENASENIYGLTLGAGVAYDVSSSLEINVDYAYREVKDFPDPNHVITVKMSIQ